jgi:tetratricopeptide (TPR) repeat protein
MLRAAKELTEAKLDRRRLWRALRALRKQLPSDRPLSSVRVLAEGDRVLVRERNTAWDPESGQTIMDFAVTELAEKVAPLVHEAAPQAKASATTGDEWFDLGLEFDQVGAWQDARVAYTEALNLNPDHVNAGINLGRLLHNDRDYERAEKLYREALRIDPGNSIAAFNLGVVLEDQGAIIQALETYQHALSVDSTIPDVHYNIARLYERQGNQQAARHHFERFQALRSQHED